jgi:hypothetical protein
MLKFIFGAGLNGMKQELLLLPLRWYVDLPHVNFFYNFKD